MHFCLIFFKCAAVVPLHREALSQLKGKPSKAIMAQPLPGHLYHHLSVIGTGTADVTRQDPKGWITAVENSAHSQPLADLFWYLRRKAGAKLNGRKPNKGWGQAYWNWYRNQHSGLWVPCLLFSHGQCNEGSQSRPFHTTQNEPVEVFPVLAFVVPGAESWAYQCPALAMMHSTLWVSHHSRFSEIPANWLQLLDAATAAVVADAAAYVLPPQPPPLAQPAHDPWFGP